MDRLGEILNLAALERRTAHAVMAVEGVAGPRLPGGRLLHLPGYPRVLITQTKRAELCVRIIVRAWFGEDLHGLTAAIQEAARGAVGETTDRPVVRVDVRFTRFAARRAMLEEARQGRIP